MNKIVELQQQLSRVLHGLNTLGFHHQLDETKRHVQQALQGLTKFQENRNQKASAKATRFDEYWGAIQAGTSAIAHSPMTAQANAKALKTLDAMIKAEQDKLAELEKQDKAGENEVLVFG